MYNKHTTAIYVAVFSSIVVASAFAISFVQQQAVAQGNQTQGNQTSGATGSNQSGSNSTSGGAATCGSITGTSGGNRY
jgi:hypothetical protein